MKNRQDYISYKLQKAAQALKEARLLIDNKMPDTAVSRMYYASFYAVNALLVSYDFNPKTHSGVKSIFNKEFILTHKLQERFSDFYTFLMAKRFEADYDDFVFINEKTVEKLLTETTEFVQAVVVLVKKEQ